jgi:NADH:ubiquinone oxidoreductase subunit 2 (subunit N)
VCGTVLVLFSRGLLGMWLRLELAFFGFVPILNGKGVYENESAVKYFVVQRIGSGVLLVGILLVGSFTGFGGLNMSFEVVNFIILVGLMVKLGIFPLHFWFPSVIGSSS